MCSTTPTHQCIHTLFNVLTYTVYIYKMKVYGVGGLYVTLTIKTLFIEY